MMETTLKPYPEYREAGLRWLDHVPSHWEVQRAKAVFQPIDVRSKTGQEELLTVSSSDGVRRRSEKKVTMFQAASYVGHKLCWPGDLVINSLWAWAKGLGISKYHGIISTAYGVYRPKKQYASFADYFHPLLRSEAYDWEFKVRSKGIWISRLQLTDTSFLDMPVLLPPAEEAEQIGRFIKDYDRRVNRLIRAKQRLIVLLNEQKQAIIQRAVTRGLDPDVPLKPSGVDWLGDVPAHWEVLRAKYVYTEIDERSTSGIETHLSMSQKHGLIPSSSLTERAYHSESYVGGKLCRGGDLVLNRLKAHLGVFALASEPGLVSPDYSVFRLHRAADERYFEFVLRTPVIRGELRMRVKGIVEGLWRLYTPDFYDICLPVPPPDEQSRIVDGLAEELTPLDDTIQKAQSEIDLIREYRTRLIADVVTGKLDVRGVAVPEVEVDGVFNDLSVAEDNGPELNDEDSLALTGVL